jgi:hypothetical protein
VQRFRLITACPQIFSYFEPSVSYTQQSWDLEEIKAKKQKRLGREKKEKVKRN